MICPKCNQEMKQTSPSSWRCDSCEHSVVQFSYRLGPGWVSKSELTVDPEIAKRLNQVMRDALENKVFEFTPKDVDWTPVEYNTDLLKNLHRDMLDKIARIMGQPTSVWQEAINDLDTTGLEEGEQE